MNDLKRKKNKILLYIFYKYLFPAKDVLRRQSWFSLVLTILSKIEHQNLVNKK